MKIDLELKSGTDRDVVASLRKIVALPIDHGQKVELAKRLILDSLVEVDKPAPIAAKIDSIGIDSAKVNNNSRREEYSSYTKAKHTGAFDYKYGRPHSTQEQIAIAACLEDPHWFAWGMQYQSNRLLLLCWQARFGNKPRIKGNMKLLTDWSLTVPPVPLI